jgi:hypothetical protein
MSETEVEVIKMVGEKKCTLCLEMGSPCEFSAGVDKPCWTCKVIQRKCSLNVDPVLEAAIVAALDKKVDVVEKEVLPTTEAAKQAELDQLHTRRCQLEYRQKELFVGGIVQVVSAMVEKFWKWTIFFYPLLGMATVPLLIGVAMLIQERVPTSKEETENEEELKKNKARVAVLANAKIAAKDVNCLEFAGIIFFGMLAIVFLMMVGSIFCTRR